MANYSEPDLINDSDHDLLFKAAYAQWLIQQSGGGGAGLPDQTGHSGEFLTTDGSTASWAAVQTAPALPAWRFGNISAPLAGEFSPNDNDIVNTTGLEFSSSSLYGSINWLTFLTANLTIGSILTFIDSQGRASIFQTTNTPAPNFGVTVLAAQSGSWSGVYQVSFAYVPSLTQILANAGITPVLDGTVSPVNSITTASGISTAIS